MTLNIVFPIFIDSKIKKKSFCLNKGRRLKEALLFFVVWSVIWNIVLEFGYLTKISF